MKKLLVIPNSLELLGSVLSTNINGVILPIEHLAVNSSIYFTVDDVRSILNLTSKEVCVSLNKIFHHSDLKQLEETLIALNKMNIQYIFFYDLAVLHLCQKLGIKKNLVLFQDHLNASSMSNRFYHDRGVSYSVITNDITKEEINQIGKDLPLMVIGYGYLPIFYSRRYLITNYLKHISKDKKVGNYYIRNKEDRYPITEEEFGTTIYTKKPINIMSEIDEMNVEYAILNSIFTTQKDFMEQLSKYLNQETPKEEGYQGFLHEKTVYKVGDVSK